MKQHLSHHMASKGRLIPIAEMNDHHLHNAIKKLAAGGAMTVEQAEHHAALKAEQDRRGGPPKPKED